MELGISAMAAFAIVLMGLLSMLLIHSARRDLANGKFKSLLNWMLITVLVSGFPYALWNFVVEAKMLVLVDPAWNKLVASIFVLLFFGFILRTAVAARKLGKEVSFKKESASIASEMEKVKKSKK